MAFRQGAPGAAGVQDRGEPADEEPMGTGPDGESKTEIADFATLGELLWREREMLDQLVCTLVVAKMMDLVSMRPDHAAETEADSAIGRMQLTEVHRAAEVEELARAADLPGGTTLAELAAAAPEPWQTVLADHRAALRTLLTDLESLATWQRSLADFLR
jgi:hypothetical protein